MKRLIPRMTWLRGFVGVVFFLIFLEGGLRMSGIVDFPVFLVDDQIGYIPSPNQQGRFLKKNDWIFNERSMGCGPFKPGEKRDFLLLSDSIVYGGNNYRQSEKLGPTLERVLGGTSHIWPVGAGSWSVLNEMTYLDRNWDLLPQLYGLIWIVNSGDFYQRSRWKSSLTHPQSRPLSATLYVFEKYLWAQILEPKLSPKRDPVEASERLEPIDHHIPDFIAYLKKIRGNFPKLKIWVVFYPNQFETSSEAPPIFLIMNQAIKEGSTDCFTLVPIHGDSRWKPNGYRDGEHPTPEGNQRIAEIVADHLLRN